MSGESNADVYASFGVNSAVMTGSNVEEHEQNMLALNVDARDGDDSIELVETNDDPYGSPTDPFAEEGAEDDEGRVQVRISTDGDEQSEEFSGEEIPEGFTEVEEEQTSEEFTAIGATPESLTSASEQLGQHETGFQEMVQQASERGLPQESIARIEAEYAEDGISEESYKELAEAGYSKAFVDSYIKGQEALIQGYMTEVQSLVGGEERFASLVQHLEATNVEAADTLFKALETRDMSTLKAILNLAGESHSRKFGKPAPRTLTARAKQSKPAAPAKSGFATQAEMVKAMSDSRYRTDSAYRREVEQRIIDSEF